MKSVAAKGFASPLRRPNPRNHSRSKSKCDGNRPRDANLSSPCIVLGFESSPGFRGKLAEREESISLRKILFHNDFRKGPNFHTIKQWHKKVDLTCELCDGNRIRDASPLSPLA